MNGINAIGRLLLCRDCLMKLSFPPSHTHTHFRYRIAIPHSKSHRVPPVLQSDSAGMDTLIDDLKAAPDPETLTLKGASMLHGLGITIH